MPLLLSWMMTVKSCNYYDGCHVTIILFSRLATYVHPETHLNFIFLTEAVFALTRLNYSAIEGDGVIIPSVELRTGILAFDFEITIKTSPGTATGMDDMTVILFLIVVSF